MAEAFGDGRFSFAPWNTPVAELSVEVVSIEYSGSSSLVIRIGVPATGQLWRVTFASVSAFRVLDEHGLLQIWEETAKAAGRPARTTFRVRNHLWTKESVVTFLATDGWSYLLATEDTCVEVVSALEPDVVREM